jgi:hypothetical protein
MLLKPSLSFLVCYIKEILEGVVYADQGCNKAAAQQGSAGHHGTPIFSSFDHNVDSDRRWFL